jgi:hypothetical protein
MLLSGGALNITALAFCNGIDAELAIKAKPKVLATIFCFIFTPDFKF